MIGVYEIPGGSPATPEQALKVRSIFNVGIHLFGRFNVAFGDGYDPGIREFTSIDEAIGITGVRISKEELADYPTLARIGKCGVGYDVDLSLSIRTQQEVSLPENTQHRGLLVTVVNYTFPADPAPSVSWTSVEGRITTPEGNPYPELQSQLFQDTLPTQHPMYLLQSSMNVLATSGIPMLESYRVA